MINIGVIGSGQIIPFHIRALKASGFFVKGISSSLNSTSAQQLAREFSIPYCFDSTDKLLASSHLFDALLLAPSSEHLFPLLKRIVPHGIPTLVEKPLFLSNSQIQDYESNMKSTSKVMVGYNRRFYETVEILHQEIRTRGLMSLRMFVPELGSSRAITGVDRVSTVLNNTVHMLDLFSHLTGIELNTLDVKVNGAKTLQPHLQLQKEFSICDIFFGIPGNYMVEAHTLDGGTFQLKPLERLFEFEGMEILEPDSINPVRRYVPKIRREISALDGLHKPGFLGQARAFRSLVENTESANQYCDVSTALSVSRLALKISNQVV